MSTKQNFISVEVVYVSEVRQSILAVSVPMDCVISQVITLSGIYKIYPEIENTELNVGIFGKQRSLDWSVQAGDRIEIYRQLRVDPKVARQERANEQAKQKRREIQNIKTKKNQQAKLNRNERK